MTNFKVWRNKILHDIKRLSHVMKLLQEEFDKLVEDINGDAGGDDE